MRLKHNIELETLSPEIGQLENLWLLGLEFTDIRELPPEIGNLTRLEVLFLEGTELTELPVEDLSRLEYLQLIDISETPISYLDELPREILDLQKTGVRIYASSWD